MPRQARGRRADASAASAPAPAGAPSERSAGGCPAPAGPRVAWAAFGRHASYPDGTPRPLARGWLHACVVLIGGLTLLAELPARLPPATRALAAVTFVPYCASAAFHVVPWRRAADCDVALAADFLGISVGFTGHVGAWAGLRSWLFAACVALDVFLAVLLAVGLSRRDRAPLKCFARVPRLGAVAAHIVPLLVLQAWHIRSLAASLFVNVVGLLITPTYFLRYAAFDAGRQGPLVIPGVWTPHENFHLLILLTHICQIATFYNERDS